jgi:hypothetical protein
MSFYSDLVGESVDILVSEPWSFESTRGDNRLVGIITAISFLEIRRITDVYFLCNVTPFHVNKVIISQVIVANRYSGSQDVIKRLVNGEESIIHLLYKSSGESIDSDKMFDIVTDYNTTRFMIGGVKLIKK